MATSSRMSWQEIQLQKELQPRTKSKKKLGQKAFYHIRLRHRPKEPK